MKTYAESKKLEALRAGNKIATLSSICIRAIRDIRANIFCREAAESF